MPANGLRSWWEDYSHQKWVKDGRTMAQHEALVAEIQGLQTQRLSGKPKDSNWAMHYGRDFPWCSRLEGCIYLSRALLFLLLWCQYIEGARRTRLLLQRDTITIREILNLGRTRQFSPARREPGADLLFLHWFHASLFAQMTIGAPTPRCLKSLFQSMKRVLLSLCLRRIHGRA